ncbi:MAG: hypothetical protein AAF394_03810 [Planctomycetota bacterium]
MALLKVFESRKAMQRTMLLGCPAPAKHQKKKNEIAAEKGKKSVCSLISSSPSFRVSQAGPGS